MSHLNKEQFENILLDVRKSYRLLYVYQRRVMDLMKFIGDSLALNYEGGWSWFSQTAPNNGKGNLDKWAWDWLTMYLYEFHFSELKSSGKKIRLSVILQSDTGFFDPGIDSKTNIDAFAPVEESETRLIFMIGMNAWHNSFDDFKDNMKKNALEYVRSKEDSIFLTKSFKLSQFMSEDGARKCLRELITFTHYNGIKEICLIN